MDDKDAGSDDTYEHISYISLNGQENTSTKMHYGEHLQRQRATENTRREYLQRECTILPDAFLKQSPVQGSSQSGADDQEVLKQQRGPATQQGRSTRYAIRHLITHSLRHHNAQSQRDGVIPPDQHRWPQDEDASS
jgi:hypothetical protein